MSQWTNEFPRAHVAKFYCWVRLIRSVLRASKFSVLKLIEIVILWFLTPSVLASAYVGTFRPSFSTLKLLYLTTDHWRGTSTLSKIEKVPRGIRGEKSKIRIWYIVLVKSDLKWCIHLRRSLFLYFNYLVSVTAGGQVSPQGHMKPSSTVDFGLFVSFWEHQNFPW